MLLDFLLLHQNNGINGLQMESFYSKMEWLKYIICISELQKLLDYGEATKALQIKM